jgi:hypothetical protein
MNAKTLIIKSKNKSYSLGIPYLADFEYQEGEIIDINIILEKSNISLYCLDFSQKWAIFVETPAAIDLYQFPFFYQAQYNHAQKLIRISFADLIEITKKLEIPQKLLLIYSVGRCGSTLLHSAFNQVKNTVSFSEPGVYSQLIIMRQWDGSNDVEISILIESCTKILCKSSESNHNLQNWVIKFRSYDIEIADLLFKHFPEAKIIFLSRDIKTWMKSMFRASLGEFPNTVESLQEMQNECSQIIALIANYKQNKPLSYVKMLTLGWISIMQRYRSFQEQGISSLAVRFEDLTIAPQKVITEILNYCDIPVTDFSQIFESLNQDSQSDTVLSQANLKKQQIELTEDDLNEIRETLKEHSSINFF